MENESFTTGRGNLEKDKTVINVRIIHNNDQVSSHTGDERSNAGEQVAVP